MSHFIKEVNNLIIVTHVKTIYIATINAQLIVMFL